jgi:hypothetical protein
VVLSSNDGVDIYSDSNLSVWNSNTSIEEKINSCYLDEHTIVFEQDLSQLVEQLKQFVFLDIYGRIPSKKVKPYHSMVQTCFPNSRFDVHISRFRLWM